jgi:hypothetical protein
MMRLTYSGRASIVNRGWAKTDRYKNPCISNTGYQRQNNAIQTAGRELRNITAILKVIQYKIYFIFLPGKFGG